MPRLKPLLIATTSVVVIASAYLWHQLRSAREANEQLHNQSTPLQITQHDERPNEFPLRAAQTTAAPPAASTSAGTAPPTAAAPLPDAAGNLPRPRTMSIRDQLNDPDYREAQRAQIRNSMPQRYPDVAKVLDFTQEQVDAFFDLLARQQFDQMVNTFSANDSEESRQQAVRAGIELARRQQTEIESQIGAVKYQKWRDYQQTLVARQHVGM